MPQFKYKARDDKGILHENTGIAESEADLKIQLKDKGLYLVELDTSVSKKPGAMDFDLNVIFERFIKVSLKDMVVFSRQFSALINAGVAMMRALTLLSDQCENPKLKKILIQIKSDVEQGTSLSDAFGKYPDVFDNLYVSLVRAGETGGVLDDVLNRVAKFLEDRAKLVGEVKSALTYPAIVSVMATVIFFVMLTFILPKFSELFGRLGSELPAYTQFLINISKVLRSAWLLLIIAVLVGFFFAFKQIYSTPEGKFHIDKLSLKIPVFGPLLKKVSVARFTRTFGTLVKSGVPILSSLEIVEESAGNEVLARVVKEIRQEVNQGGSITTPLERSKIFPGMVVSMISIGEETGELDAMLEKIADFYDLEVENAVAAMTSLIEPIMIVVLGGLVGAVIVGMYLPMFKMFEAIG